MINKYSSFETDDFVLDDNFRNWVIQPTPERNAFWNQFIVEHPHQHKKVEEARLLVQALQVNWVTVTEQQSLQSYKRLEGKLFNQTTIPLWKKPQAWYRVAAVIALLLVSIAAWLAVEKFVSETTYQTAYGKIQTITLPDQSIVTLNANSKLTLPRNWNSESSREVWLEGEAYFKVKHLKDHRKFLVHTSDKLTVEVLGTAFNVFGRESGTRVVLASGKVKLNIESGKEEKEVLMQPGELVELEANSGAYSKKRVNPEIVSAWTEHKLVFDDTPISEIVSILEETYGLRVKVTSPELLEKRVFGSSPTDDINVFLTALSKSFGLHIERNGKEVIISSP